MEIHKPKPWHGLREFLKEYAIIVIGVLTALAAEQVVETWRSHDTLGVLKGSLSRELAEDRGRWELLRQQDDCMERRVRGLIAWTRSAPPGVAHEEFAAVMLPSLHASAWELARSNPAFTHMPVREQMAYSSLYDALANQQHYLYEEQARWHVINGLVILSDDPEARRVLARELSAALGYQKRRQFSYPYIHRRFDALSIRANTSVLADLQLIHCGT